MPLRQKKSNKQSTGRKMHEHELMAAIEEERENRYMQSTASLISEARTYLESLPKNGNEPQMGDALVLRLVVRLEKFLELMGERMIVSDES